MPNPKRPVPIKRPKMEVAKMHKTNDDKIHVARLAKIKFLGENSLEKRSKMHF